MPLDIGSNPPVGAYGLRLPEGRLPHLGAARPDDPAVAVEVEVGEAPDTPGSLGPDRFSTPLAGGGWVEVQATATAGAQLLAARAVFTFPTPPPAFEVTHPLLAAVGAGVAVWTGRLALHAGAFVADGRAWLVTAPSSAGKSALLAAADAAGLVVLSDDLAVVDAGEVVAGPRALDLRDPADAGGRPTVATSRGRAQLALGACPASAPLAGVVTLDWGEECTLEPLRGAERARVVLAARSTPARRGAGSDVLDTAARPVLRFRRPFDRTRLADDAHWLATQLTSIG